MPRIRRPLCWMAVFYALGLLTAGMLPERIAAIGLVAGGIAALVCMRRGRTAAFLLLAVAFACAGMLRMQAERRVPYAGFDAPVSITARVCACQKIDEDEGYALLLVDRIAAQDGTKIAEGKRVRLTVRLTPGQTVDVGGTISAPQTTFYALRGRRNPGGFDQEGYYRSRGVVMTASAGAAWACEPPKGPSLYAALHTMRGAVAARIDALFTYAAPLYQGLLLGDKDGIDEEVYADIRRSGTAHLLAVSGLHVSALMGFVLWAAHKRQLSLRLSTVLALAVLWSYALATGMSASTLRACIMGSLMLGARALHIRYDAPCAWAAAFLLLSIVNPWYIRDVGFVLSFTTVGGLLLFAPALQRALEKLPGALADTLAVSLGAQLACLPFQITYFGEFSLIGFVMNLLCVPLATALVVGGLLLLALSAVLYPLASVLAPVFRIGAALLQGMTRAASNISFASVRVAALPAAAMAAYVAGAFFISPYFDRAKHTRLLCLGATAVCGAILCVALAAPPATQYVTLDVGQGDSAVLRTKEGAVCVIDAGPTGNSELTGYLHHEGLDVDVLILSHLDSDHAGGLTALANARIPVRQIVVPYGCDSAGVDAAVSQALAQLHAQGSAITGAGRGDWMELPGAQIVFLGPDAQAKGSNGRSLATRLEAQGVTILSMGDVPQEEEPLRGVSCDVLKVAHHGSRDGTSMLFLHCAQPKLALVSVGRNAFGHPSDEVLARLEAVGAEVLRTDVCGATTLTLQDAGYDVKTTFHTGE